VARPRRERKSPARLLRAGGAGVRHDDPGGTPEVIAASTGKFQARNNPKLRRECYHRPMNSLLRALTSLIVGVTTVVGMVVYQHYSREPPGDAFTVAVMAAASILAWLVTGLE